MNNRIQHIDIAKGITISLVALFHTPLLVDAPGIQPLSLFRMPLFFFLSGIFFSWQTRPIPFIAKISDALLKPYFSFILLIIILLWLKSECCPPYTNIFYGGGYSADFHWATPPLWFLTHLYALYIFSYFVFRFTRLDSLTLYKQIAIIFVAFFTGVLFFKLFWPFKIHITGQTYYGLPFSFDIILLSSSYFILGNLLKEKIINFKPNMKLLTLMLFTFLMISKFTDAHIDLIYRVYTNPIFATLGSISGIYIVIHFSFFISKIKWLASIPLKLGESSLFILIFHFVIQVKLFDFLSSKSTSEAILLIFAVITFAVSILIPLLIRNIVIRSDLLSLAFLPFKSNKLVQQFFAKRSSSKKNRVLH